MMEMNRTKGGRVWTALATGACLLGASLLEAGCRVATHKEGDNENVRIASPFGDMSVKTNEQVVQSGMGLTPYPGAVLEKKKDKNDDQAADVNMSFGGFHLGVKAMAYLTPDSPDKVLDFYRKDMARYGVVLTCRDHDTVGTPVRTQDGLTCADEEKSHVHVSDSNKGTELKAGSHQRQHIVSVETKDGGTRIGLVALELPGHFSISDDQKE